MNGHEQNNGEFVIVSASASDARSQELRAQYFAIRKKAFDARWPGQDFYTNNPDAFDLDQRTVFGVYVLNGNVRAGARLLMHEPSSDEQTRSELTHPRMSIASMFDDIDAKSLSYCEYGGGVVDDDREGLPKHLSTDLVTHILTQIKNKNIKNNGQPIQLVLGIASKLGLHPFIRGATDTGIAGIVREDRIQMEENEHVDTLMWPIILSISDEVPLMTPAREDAGAKAKNIAAYLEPKESRISP